ncbi:hypothetical protein YC2023_032394 [Brassica napus]
MGMGWRDLAITYFPQDVFKVAIRYILSGKAWLNLFEKLTAFTMKKDYRKEEREKSQWALAQRTFHERKLLAEQAERRAEIARLRELHALMGHVESVVGLVTKSWFFIKTF